MSPLPVTSTVCVFPTPAQLLGTKLLLLVLLLSKKLRSGALNFQISCVFNLHQGSKTKYLVELIYCCSIP